MEREFLKRTSRCAIEAFGVFYALETVPDAPEQEQSGAENIGTELDGFNESVGSMESEG